MIVYLILPILAYVLTGCNKDDDDEIPNTKVSTSNNDFTVFYGTVSGNYINMSEVFTDVPTLTGITFNDDVVYSLVESTSSSLSNAILLTPAKTFTIKGNQTVNSSSSYILDVDSTTGLPSTGTFYFVRFIGNAIKGTSPISWNS